MYFVERISSDKSSNKFATFAIVFNVSNTTEFYFTVQWEPIYSNGSNNAAWFGFISFHNYNTACTKYILTLHPSKNLLSAIAVNALNGYLWAAITAKNTLNWNEQSKQKWFSDGLQNEIIGFEMELSKYERLSVLLRSDSIKSEMG